MTTPTVRYFQLEHYDDMDTESVGGDLVLADLSDSDTRSVDFLLDDFRLDAPHGVPKVSVWIFTLVFPSKIVKGRG